MTFVIIQMFKMNIVCMESYDIGGLFAFLVGKTYNYNYVT